MNFVEICNVYANQVVIKVAVSVINSDKLSRSYNDLYLGVTFFYNTGCNNILHTQQRVTKNCW